MTELEPIGELLPGFSKRHHRRLTPDEVPLTDREELILELVHVGVGLRKAQSLIDRFPAERIQRQLRWLAQRSPRKPASLLIAAIEEDYDPPAYGADD